ncbi:MAG: phosphatidate cytidylyltransferase [bacterium]
MHQRRLLTGLFVVPVFLLCLFHRFGPELTLLVVGAFLTMSAEELWKIVAGSAGKSVFSGCLLVAWALLVSAYLRSLETAVCVLVAGTWFVTILVMRTTWRGGRLRLSSAYVLLFYLVLPMVAIVALRMAPDGGQLVGFLLLVSCLTDTGGLYVGCLFGRRKLAPNLSPKKTVEGAIGGLVFACASVVSGV